MKIKTARVYDGCKKEESHCKCCKKSRKKVYKKRPLLKCSSCDYNSIGHAAMKRHMENEHETDQNKNLVKCEVCTYETSTKAGLWLHMYRAHKLITKRGEIKECQECGYKSDKGQMKFDEHECEAVRCEWCDFKSNSPLAVSIHRKKMHMEEVKKNSF